MSYPSFEKLEKQALKAQPVRQNKNGMGKSVMLDCEGARGLRFSSPKEMRQKWTIAPSGMKDTIDPEDKMNIEVEIGPEHAEFASKCFLLDQFVMEQAFVNRKDWFGDKNASKMESIDSLRMTYSKLVSEGKRDKNGNKYPDGVKLKVEGWAPYLDHTDLYTEGARKGMVKDCVWKNRFVDDMNPIGVKDNETRFYLYESKDPVTNIENYISKLPVVDAAMNHLKNKDGNGVWRHVGPQDCKPNSRLRIVFSTNRVWISDIRFGISLSAKEIWMKPPPPPTVQKLEGVRVNPKVDIASAMKLITNLENAEFNSDFHDDDSDGDDELVVTKAPSAPSAQAVESFAMDVEAVEVKTEKAEKSPEPKKRKKADKESVKALVVENPL